jgi:hypothetical protein
MLASATAHAELTAVELQSRGEALAKDGRYSEAIDAFKAADRIEVRASHACLIALGYARRDLWTQAELWRAICQERARPDDPVPEWGAQLDEQIRTQLAAVPAVTFVVEPSTARLALADYPDAVFRAGTIHLPPGHHVILAHAPGYVDAQRTIDVQDATPQHVAIALVTAPALPPPTHTLLYAGLGAAGLGLISYGVMSYTYLRLDNNDGFHGGIETTYKVTRVATIGLWTIGGGLLIAAALQHRSAETPTVAISPAPGGGVVSIGWQR